MKKKKAAKRKARNVTLVGRRGQAVIVPRRQFLAPAMVRAVEAAAPRLAKAVKLAAANIPDDIKAPNFGAVRGESFVRPGRYVMRNGSNAIVVQPVTLKFGIQMRQTWQGWKGFLDGHPEGEGLVWGLDGKRSDATPMHEHDLLHRSKNQKYRCVRCGCTDDRACKGGCSWVAPGFCSVCFPDGVMVA